MPAYRRNCDPAKPRGQSGIPCDPETPPPYARRFFARVRVAVRVFDTVAVDVRVREAVAEEVRDLVDVREGEGVSAMGRVARAKKE